MSAWSKLTKKEFQLGFPIFLTAIIVFAAVFTGGYFLGDYLGIVNEILLMATIFVVVGHVFILAIYLLFSLNTERKRMHLWLHNPMSIAGLLSAKFVSGLIYFIPTLTISVMLVTTFINRFPELSNSLSMSNMISLIFLVTISASIFLATTVLFFWTIFHILSQQMNDFLSFILTFLIFIIASMLLEYVTDLSAVQVLFNWGAIQTNDIILGFEFNIQLGEQPTESVEEINLFYLGNLFRDLIVMVILFIASCWLIDRKVEV